VSFVTLSLTWRRLVIRLEIFSRVRDQFAVGWMIEGLNAHDFREQSRGVVFDVLDEFRFGICRSCDQDGARMGDSLGHVLQERVVLRGMAAADGIGPVVNLSVRVVGMQNKTIDFGRAEMKNASFVVIDPNDSVKKFGHDMPLPAYFWRRPKNWANRLTSAPAAVPRAGGTLGSGNPSQDADKNE
jgi:hypothetical protein